MMKKILLTSTLLLAMSSATAEVTIPHTFTANTPAKAAEVNENFTALKNAVESMSTIYSASDYVATADVTKTFTVTSHTSWDWTIHPVMDWIKANSSSSQPETYTSTGVLTLNGSNATTEMTHPSQSSSYTLKYHTSLTASGLVQTGVENSNKGKTSNESMLIMPTQMKIGDVWGGNFYNYTYINTLNNEENLSTTDLFKRLSNVTTMSIGGQNYECLEIEYIGKNVFDYYCKGIGYAKTLEEGWPQTLTAVQ